MSGAGAARFGELDDYQARLTLASMNIVVTEPGVFDASLIWAKLPDVFMLDVTERLARVAYIALPPHSIFLSFAKHPGNETIWNGIHVPYGQIIHHASGETFHQRVPSFSQWGLVAVSPDFLSSFGSAYAGRSLAEASFPQVLRPPPKLVSRLLRLHARLARVAQTRPSSLGSHELGRSVEQELLLALVPCLTDSDPRRLSHLESDNIALMARFEALVLDHKSWSLPAPELPARLMTSARSLRSCCLAVLGISPAHYLLLRRLHLVRSAIRHDLSASRTLNDIAQDFDFSDVARFSDEYFDAFGETPAETRQRPRRLFV